MWGLRIFWTWHQEFCDCETKVGRRNSASSVESLYMWVFIYCGTRTWPWWWVMSCSYTISCAWSYLYLFVANIHATTTFQKIDSQEHAIKHLLKPNPMLTWCNPAENIMLRKQSTYPRRLHLIRNRSAKKPQYRSPFTCRSLKSSLSKCACHELYSFLVLYLKYVGNLTTVSYLFERIRARDWRYRCRVRGRDKPCHFKLS